MSEIRFAKSGSRTSITLQVASLTSPRSSSMATTLRKSGEETSSCEQLTAQA